MRFDSSNFIFATISGGWAWLTAENLAIVVPCLWACYVLLLILKAGPEALEKHPWVARLALRALLWLKALIRFVFRRPEKDKDV